MHGLNLHSSVGLRLLPSVAAFFFGLPQLADTYSQAVQVTATVQSMYDVYSKAHGSVEYRSHERMCDAQPQPPDGVKGTGRS
jgi:hypothetical protein